MQGSLIAAEAQLRPQNDFWTTRRDGIVQVFSDKHFLNVYWTYKGSSVALQSHMQGAVGQKPRSDLGSATN